LYKKILFSGFSPTKHNQYDIENATRLTLHFFSALRAKDYKDSLTASILPNNINNALKTNNSYIRSIIPSSHPYRGDLCEINEMLDQFAQLIKSSTILDPIQKASLLRILKSTPQPARDKVCYSFGVLLSIVCLATFFSCLWLRDIRSASSINHSYKYSDDYNKLSYIGLSALIISLLTLTQIFATGEDTTVCRHPCLLSIGERLDYLFVELASEIEKISIDADLELGRVKCKV
jgi:hypothetical protein